jgi:translation initiation factor 4B
MRPDQPAKSPTPPRDTTTPSSPAGSVAPLAAAKPAGRPKLNLQKRTVSEAESPQQATSATDSKASPFGAARPIDTQTREKEIEEKRQQVLQQKKEEDKAKEEKKRQAKEAAKAEKATGDKDKENGAAPAGKNYEILRKTANGDEGVDAEDEDQNGKIVDDKNVKPKETVQDAPQSEGAWRGKPDNTTDSLEADGWSTVSKAKNNRKSGNPAARAIAS